VRTFNGLAEVTGAVGEELGVSDWFTVTQAVIDAFADATGDHQFIHVDPERARETPFGTTIAHGLLTLSLGPRLMDQIYRMDGIALGVNYGYGKVRFPAPLPVDSDVRARGTLAAADGIAGGLQLTVVQTFEVQGGTKPVCVAESIIRVYGD
jgi:acyl dehydratase